jgi:hypothetical protein
MPQCRRGDQARKGAVAAGQIARLGGARECLVKRAVIDEHRIQRRDRDIARL